MDEDIIEINQIEHGYVVLAIPALRLIVMGRTLNEAQDWARSAIAYRGLTPSQRAEPPRVLTVTCHRLGARTRHDRLNS